MKRMIWLGLLALASAPALLAGQVHVPGDFATIQAAIDNSPSGTVIIVHGGKHGEIVVDRQLTLVGDPSFTIEAAGWDPNWHQYPGVLLNGPGTGEVTIVRAVIASTAFTSTYAAAGAGIAGHGFQRLRVLHCDVHGSDAWGDESLNGGAGIEVDVANILIEDSTVTGGDNRHDVFGGGWAPPPGAGVKAPGSTVTLLDSTVTGGKAPGTAFAELPYNPCPVCSGIQNGEGAAGVIANRLFHANSTVAGGAGGTFECFTMSGTFVPICTLPAGPGVVANQQVDLHNALVGSGPLLLNSSWNLSWTTVGNPVLLLLSAHAPYPLQLGDGSWLFLSTTNLLVFVVPGGGTNTAVFAVPASASLVGTTVAFQVYDPPAGLTRPVAASVVP